MLEFVENDLTITYMKSEIYLKYNSDQQRKCQEIFGLFITYLMSEFSPCWAIKK